MAKLRIRIGEQQWTTDATLSQLLNVEVMAIERATGLTLTEFSDSLKRGSIVPITALVWILRRRQEPGLELDAVSFALAELDTDIVDDEDDAVAQGKDEASVADSASTSTTSSTGTSSS